MSFSYSSGVITQTGTDTDLSGLNGLTGITTSVSNPNSAPWGQNNYIMDSSTRLEITGVLTIEPDKECLIVEGDATDNITTNPIRVTGTLNYGVAKTRNGNTIYSYGVGLNFTSKSNNSYAFFSLYVNGTLIWNGGSIRTASTIRIDQNSILTINKSVFLNSLDNDDRLLRLTPNSTLGSSNMNIYDLELSGVSESRPSRFFTSWGFNTAVFTLKNGLIQQYNGANPEQVYTKLKNKDYVSTTAF